MDLKDPNHALNLVLHHCLEILSEKVLGLVNKIHNFNFPQRIALLNKTQKENNFKELSPKHYAKTRWLSLEESLERFLDMWDGLRKFVDQKPSLTGVTTKQYEKLLSLLNDKKLRFDIIFLSGVRNKINKANVELQNSKLEIQNLKIILFKLVKSIMK